VVVFFFSFVHHNFIFGILDIFFLDSNTILETSSAPGRVRRAVRVFLFSFQHLVCLYFLLAHHHCIVGILEIFFS
jgi:hypothetical protein